MAMTAQRKFDVRSKRKRFLPQAEPDSRVPAPDTGGTRIFYPSTSLKSTPHRFRSRSQVSSGLLSPFDHQNNVNKGAHESQPRMPTKPKHNMVGIGVSTSHAQGLDVFTFKSQQRKKRKKNKVQGRSSRSTKSKYSPSQAAAQKRPGGQRIAVSKYAKATKEKGEGPIEDVLLLWKEGNTTNVST